MTLEQILNETEMKMQGLVGKIQQLDQEKQGLLQETLRVDGEIRILKRLIKDKNTAG